MPEFDFTDQATMSGGKVPSELLPQVGGAMKLSLCDLLAENVPPHYPKLSVGGRLREGGGHVAMLTSPHEWKEDALQTAGRLFWSVGAGCLTRGGVYLSGLQRIPKVGPVCTIVAPFVAAGLTSSYLKTGEFTDLRSAAEGALAYGFIAHLQSYNTTRAETSIAPPHKWHTGTSLGWDEKAMSAVSPRKLIGR